MASDQKTAVMVRRILFRAKGGNYTALFMADSGDLFQQYADTDSGRVYYPEITSAKPVTLRLTVAATNSETALQKSQYTVVYCVAGVDLAFNGTSCTTPGFAATFKLDGNGNLKIIGNIADISGGTSFIISAKVRVGDVLVVVDLPVSVSRYTEGSAAKVTIAPGDEHNFTIGEAQNTSVLLKARVFKDKVWQDSGFYYEWGKLSLDGWETLAETGPQLTVTEGMVDTYSDFRVIVYERNADGSKGAEIGQDTQGVLDASNPLDIEVTIKVNTTGNGAGVATTDESLDDSMPDTAYLEYAPKLVRRNGQPLTGNVSFSSATLVNAMGAKLMQIPYSSGCYRVTVGDFNSTVSDGESPKGEYNFVFEGYLS